MVSVYRTTAIWSGFAGAPGYTKMSWADLTDSTSRNAALAKVAALFDAVKAYLPTGTTVQVQSAIDEFDMATGALIGASTGTLPPLTTSTAAAASYAGGSGICLTWNTGLIYNRRRVRGRTFFVPTANIAMEQNGTLSPAAITAFGAAAATFLALTAPRPNIWSRQWSNSTPPVQIGGSLAPIDTYTLRDMASQLRSRRL